MPLPNHIAVPAQHPNPLPAWLDVDVFFATVEASADGPAKALILQAREKALANGSSPKAALTPLLGTALYMNPTDRAIRVEWPPSINALINTMQASDLSAQECRPSSYPKPSNLQRHITRREMLASAGAVAAVGAVGAGAVALQDTHNDQDENEPTSPLNAISLELGIGTIALGAAAYVAVSFMGGERTVGAVK